MFSWWEDQGAAAGFTALLQLYARERPNSDVANRAQVGASAPNPRQVLKVRMLTGDPPDLFQARAGQGVVDPWVLLDKLEPLDDLFQASWLHGWLPKGMRDLCSAQGRFWCAPLSVQRTNVLWYNRRLFAQHQLDPPRSFDDFLAVAAALQGQEVIPLALGDQDPLPAAHLFEALLMGTLSPRQYRGLWTRETSWADGGVIEALKRTQQALALANEDHRSLTWEQAVDLVVAGRAGMTIMGDWAEARFRAAGAGDHGWAPAPDGAGVCGVVAEAFALPRGAKNREEALVWLRLVASRDGQDAFNAAQGASIPARVDGGHAAYGDYFKWSMQEYQASEIIPSGIHGLGAREPWATRIAQAIREFTEHGDVTQAQDALGQACLDEGACR
jgi:glucose/mannose transport system substrate-binding protein